MQRLIEEARACLGEGIKKTFEKDKKNNIEREIWKRDLVKDKLVLPSPGKRELRKGSWQSPKWQPPGKEGLYEIQRLVKAIDRDADVSGDHFYVSIERNEEFPYFSDAPKPEVDTLAEKIAKALKQAGYCCEDAWWEIITITPLDADKEPPNWDPGEPDSYVYYFHIDGKKTE